MSYMLLGITKTTQGQLHFQWFPLRRGEVRNLKDAKTKIFPSKTRGGKELPSSSALDSPSVLNRLATPPHAINSDMLQVIGDATSSMNDAYDDASTLLDDNVPLGEFLDEQLAELKY